MTHPIRVCFPYVGDSVGGSHISSTLALRYMDRAAVDPVVVLHRDDGPLAGYLADHDVAFEILPWRELAGEAPNLADIAYKSARSLLPLVRFLRQHRIDLVHSNDLRMHLSWGPAARLAGVKFLWNQRVVVSTSPLWRLLAASAHSIASVSEAARGTLPANGRRKAEVIYSPFEATQTQLGHADARAALAGQLNLLSQDRVVGFVGNITAQKRPLLFVEAAARLCDATDRHWRFIMVGEDRANLSPKITARANDLGIGDLVHLAGYQGAAVDWLAGFDVLISCGVGEAYGRVLVESALSGTPIVATDSGGNPEIVFDETVGALTPVDDAARLAENTLMVLLHGSRTPEAAKRLLIARHAPERCADAFIDLYRRMIARTAP